MKRQLLIVAAALLGVLSAFSTELLSNGGFEVYTSKATMFGTSTQFDDWDVNAIMGVAIAADTTDVVEGKAAFKTNSEHKGNGAYIYQELNCSEYQVGDTFSVRVCFKNVNVIDSALTLGCYWESTTGSSEPIGQTDEMKQVLPYTTSWDTVAFQVVKPEGGKYFAFKIYIRKSAQVLIDNCSFEYITPTVPYFAVSPNKNYTFTTNINSDTVVAQLIIRQFNLTQPVQLVMSGKGKAAYTVSKSQVTAPVDTVTVSFSASKVGTYSALLNISDDESPVTSLMNTSIAFNGTAVDTTQAPVITITPLEFDTFRCKAYESVTDTFIVSSSNCYDYVHVVVDDETGDPWAFGLSDSFFTKNSTDTVIITFAPVKEGTYTARFKAYTTGMDTIYFSTVGVAGEGKPEPPVVDYDTTFVWNNANAYALLNEGFDMGTTLRNKTLVVTDWQNVVRQGTRAWWGFDSDSTKQAKMTSYMWQTDSGSVAFESWLITPALDYRNAQVQMLSFQVMSDILYKGQTGKLEVYYIDAMDTTNVFFQHIEAIDSLIPYANDEQEYVWKTIYMDLTGQSLIADVFYIGFKFTDMGGNNGVTYYVDNVTWGFNPMLAIESIAEPTQTTPSKFLKDGHLYIQQGTRTYSVIGF